MKLIILKSKINYFFAFNLKKKGWGGYGIVKSNQ